MNMNTRFDKKLQDRIHLWHNNEAKSMLNRELAQARDGCGTLLHHAALYGNDEITRHLIKLGADVDASGKDGRTPLMNAVRYRKLATVELLLEAGANIDIVDANGETVLQSVFKHTYSENYIVRLLYNKLRDESVTTEDLINRLKTAGCTLYHTVRTEDLALTRSMLESGVDVDSRGDLGITAFQAAIDKRDWKLAKWLLERGANINAQDQDGFCALSFAAMSNDKVSIQFLLENGADPNIKNYYSEETPLFILAVQVRDNECVYECMELLMQYGANPHNHAVALGTIFDAALESVDPARADYLISHLVLLEKRGIPNIESVVRCKIEENKEYLTNCHEDCERILGSAMFQTLSLFGLLTDSDFKMRMYVRNEEFTSKIEECCREKKFSESHPYYFNTLMKRVKKAVNLVKLENFGIPIICSILNGNENEYYIAARKVVGYLNMHELEQLAKVQKV